jgi:outer membrane protein TolC
MSIGDAFINPYTRYQSVLGINVGYNLFDFGVRGGNLKIAKEDVALKELETKQKYQEMNLTLLDSYTKILITTKQLAQNKAILELEEKNLEYYERLYAAKEVSKTELNGARVKVKNIKNKISDLTSIKQDSINWLSFYTGEQYDIKNLTVEDIKESDFDALAFKDYTKSLVWKIHDKNIRKKELELGVVKRTNYPKITVYGRYYLYGSNQNSYRTSLGNIEPSNFSVGASLNMPLFDGFKNSANIQKTALELKQLHVERDKAIAQLMTRLTSMRTNLMYLDEQINENNEAIKELTDKEKSMSKLVSNRVVSPIEGNEAKVDLLTQQIELDKNTLTKISIEKGIEILTEEY